MKFFGAWAFCIVVVTVGVIATDVWGHPPSWLEAGVRLQEAERGEKRGKRNNERFEKHVERLSVVLPAEVPVRVVFKDLSDSENFAFVVRGKRRFRIVIHEGLGYQQRVACLIHEWAHCLDWRNVGVNDHGPRWGLMFSKCYRVVIEDWDGEW